MGSLFSFFKILFPKLTSQKYAACDFFGKFPLKKAKIYLWEEIILFSYQEFFCYKGWIHSKLNPFSLEKIPINSETDVFKEKQFSCEKLKR